MAGEVADLFEVTIGVVVIFVEAIEADDVALLAFMEDGALEEQGIVVVVVLPLITVTFVDDEGRADEVI